MIKKNEIFELKFSHEPVENPWQVVIPFVFNCGSLKYQIHGFYYGNNIWKVRFCPEVAGRWHYRGIAFEQVFEGSFLCDGNPETANGGFLRIDEDNPIWWCNSKGPVYLCGVNLHQGLEPSFLADIPDFIPANKRPERYEYQGSFDLQVTRAIEMGAIDVIGRPQEEWYRLIRRKLDKCVENGTNYVILDLTHSARQGAPVSSNFQGLYEDSFTEPYKYNENSGLIWDYTLEYARDRGIYVKLHLHNFCDDWSQHPFRVLESVNEYDKKNPGDILKSREALKAWATYAKYVASRYGAFSNVILAVGNEVPGYLFTGSYQDTISFCNLILRTFNKYRPYPSMLTDIGNLTYLYDGESPLGSHEVKHKTCKGDVKSAAFYYFEAQTKPYLCEEDGSVNILGEKEKEEATTLAKSPMEGDLPFTDEQMHRLLAASRRCMWGSFMGGGSGCSLFLYDTNRREWEFLKLNRWKRKLVDELQHFDELKPANEIIKAHNFDWAACLASKHEMVVFCQRDESEGQTIVLELPFLKYEYKWYCPQTGTWLASGSGDSMGFIPPESIGDIVLLVKCSA